MDTVYNQMHTENGSFPEEAYSAETEAKGTYKARMEEGDALRAGQRYKEAISAYSVAISLDLFSYEAYRMRAEMHLVTLQPSKAMLDFEKCRMLGGDESEISFLIGLCWFLAGIYDKAIYEFTRCIDVCDDELAIAAIYWEMIAAWRMGTEPKLMKYYHDEMFAGRNTAHKTAVCTAMGRITLREAFETLKKENDENDFPVMAYGIAQYCLQVEKPKNADKILSELLRRDGSRTNHAYLAALNDRMREEATKNKSLFI